MSVAQCGVIAFLVPFIGGLVVATLVLFVFAPHAIGLSDLLVSFLFVLSFIGIPWGVCNALVSILIGFGFFFGGSPRATWHIISGFACALVLSSIGVYLLLQEQKTCDSVCLGLEEKLGGLIPIWAVIIVFPSLVGVLQAHIYQQYLALQR